MPALSMIAALAGLVNLVATEYVELQSASLALFAIREDAPFSGFPINSTSGGFWVNKPADP